MTKTIIPKEKNAAVLLQSKEVIKKKKRENSKSTAPNPMIKRENSFLNILFSRWIILSSISFMTV